MAIVKNISTEVGDVILIQADVPIIGLITLTDFIDDVEGGNINRFFTKEFRYTLDGINFTSWFELTEQNLQNVEVSLTDTFFIEYRYTHAGDVDESQSTSLTFNSVTVSGDFEAVECGENYDRSVFKRFFGCHDTEVLNWCINVTEKLYKQGIIPKFINRGAISSTTVDRDYIDFWRSVACFFAFFVVYARQFEKFASNPDLLLDFLLQKGIFLCNEAEQIQDLIYVANFFYDEVRKRGTEQIANKKGVNGAQVHGELRRVLCYDPTCDEFLFGLAENKYIGWTIDQSSPLYKGLTVHKNLNKAYEDTQDVVDLSLYPLINSSLIVIEEDLDECESFSVSLSTVFDCRETMSIKLTDITTGIGDLDVSKAIDVDPTLNYEITFLVKQPILENNFTFGVIGTDSVGNQIAFQNIVTGGDDNFFFEQIKLNRDDKYYLVRGIIFRTSEPLKTAEEGALDIGYGTHLRFEDSICKIIPYIVLDRDTSISTSISQSASSLSTALRIWDLKIKPLATPFSMGFVQVANFIYMFLKNNNGTYSNEEIDQIIRKYLIPYNSTFETINLPYSGDDGI